MARIGKFVAARPLESDAARIAEIHLAAMAPNPLLHAQFPSAAGLAALRRFLEANMARQLLRDRPASSSGSGSGSGVLVARDPDTGGAIAGFAMWDSSPPPRREEEEAGLLEGGDLRFVEGCRREFLDGYAARAEEAKRRALGDRACYHLSFVCTDPAYQGRGAGTLLTREVLRMAAADGLPVYLESTEAAVSMYKRLGFRVLDAFEMRIPRAGSAEPSEVYRELCMVWYQPPGGRDGGEVGREGGVIGGGDAEE